MHIAYMYYLANIKEINSQLDDILYPNEQKEKEQPNRSNALREHSKSIDKKQ